MRSGGENRSHDERCPFGPFDPLHELPVPGITLTWIAPGTFAGHGLDGVGDLVKAERVRGDLAEWARR